MERQDVAAEKPFAGRRATVMGLGRYGGGVSAVRYLASRGARVTITDAADAESLADSLKQLRGAALEAVHLGGHLPEHFAGADLVVVNPAVPPSNRALGWAREAGAALTSETELFLAACPAPVIGITGSNGKSTTAAMTAAILHADGRRVWLGGNIGRSLLDDLGRIGPSDWVVLELSSFQLARLSVGARFPHVAVVTNCSPNHLDWHGGYDDYVAAKQRLLSGQSPDGIAVLNPRDPEVGGWSSIVRGRQCLVPDEATLPKLRLPGAHQRANAACAAAAAEAVGCEPAAISRGLADFVGLPHRLEFVAEVDGRRFYNDSASTTPESTTAALESFERAWLLVGGAEKGASFQAMLTALARRAAGVAFYGAAGDRLASAFATLSPRCAFRYETALPAALEWCWRRARPGEAIVLSPGCASFDQYRDYRERGEHFVALARDLQRLRRNAHDNALSDVGDIVGA